MAEAYKWCEHIATSHYENFPVGSLILPAAMRPHVFAVYAFSRVADDIADEPWTESAEERLQQLTDLEIRVHQWHAGNAPPESPLGIAVSHTMKSCSLDKQLFLSLLSAFRQDVEFVQPESWSDVFDYCNRSANPVGRLVLAIAGVHDDDALSASDDVCTALQLINFWQDLSIDIPRRRWYLPSREINEHGAQKVLLDGIGYAGELMHRGSIITRHVHGRLRWELSLIIAVAMRILRRCEDMREKLFHQRPTLRRADYFWALASLLSPRWHTDHL